ncbi:MAG: ABC transporter ATP-binding protein [Alphaproteobacteria bacterium]
MSTIVRLSRVSKVFAGGVRAVEDLDLAVEEGEFVTLLGPSGCGKTTTLRLVAGFETADSGRIELAGADVTELPPYRRQVNTVFQDYALFPHMTVAENVAYGLRIAGGRSRAEIAKAAAGTLDLVGLRHLGHRLPAQLSGGQRQRVAVARALARLPKVLLLDEPLSALDVKLREAMQVELRRLHERLGITFLMVTHDQREALVMSDRVAVMREGRLIQAGAPRELYDRPATPYVAEFIGTSNLLAGRVVRAAGREVELDFGGGTIRGFLPAAAGPLAPGAQATACVRPERVRVAAADAAAAHGSLLLAAEVVGHLFYGSNLRLETALGAPPRCFLVDLPRGASAAGLAVPPPGARANLAIDPADVIVFAGGSE